ncbi:MAG: carbon-nitrogen hydrolase family protein [Parasphingorhabdus sp.]
MKKRIALAQMCSGIDAAANAETLREFLSDAAEQGADMVFTPEMTGMMDCDRDRARKTVCTEQNDVVLQTAQQLAKQHRFWINLGSLAILDESEGDNRWLNRSFLIDPTGRITARYDKIHLFDVKLGSGEAYLESRAYRPGNKAVVSSIGKQNIGLTICYDLRFAGLYAALAEAGVDIISVPAAFTVPTGRAHWESLLRARAIESAAFVVAATQCGEHSDGRKTHGHSMVVDPWGEILLDMGQELGIGVCEIDFAKVQEVRERIPVLTNRREFQKPNNDEAD